MAGGHEPTRTLVWFRRQLRVDDQPLLAGMTGPVAGVWILDPRELLAEDPLDFPRCCGRRLRFILESVDALRASLRRLGSELMIRMGKPEVVLPDLVAGLGVTRVRLVREPGTEERAIERALLKRLNAQHPECDQDALDPECLYELDDVFEHARDLPEVFSNWRRQVEKRMQLGHPVEAPSRLETLSHELEPGALPSLTELGVEEPGDDDRGVMVFRGGEPAAFERLRSWVFDRDCLRSYKETRNGLLGADYSSKLSPWLALGCISSRRVAEQTLVYEDQRVANDSTYWLRFELHWREYFRLYLLKHGRLLFHADGPQGRELDWGRNRETFDAWCRGRTGVDFVDANMIELASTGFMSNRGRQNVASFLAKNLGIDWRWGARWFESRLVDYCPAANWGNWAYAAGVGADPRGFRGFDVIGQAQRYDPGAEYSRLWLRGLDRPRPIVDPRRSLADAEERWHPAERKRRASGR